MTVLTFPKTTVRDNGEMIADVRVCVSVYVRAGKRVAFVLMFGSKRYAELVRKRKRESQRQTDKWTGCPARCLT